jgi:hypothetical protein
MAVLQSNGAGGCAFIPAVYGQYLSLKNIFVKKIFVDEKRTP